jgi:hypothetical protein
VPGGPPRAAGNAMEPDDALPVMRHRPLRRTRAHLDDLIDGRPTSLDPLADLVAAVRAPGGPHELGGLDGALAAFVAAPGAAQATQENPLVLKTLAGRLLALKLLALAAGAVTAGGVAYAAVNNNVSSPHGASIVASDENSGAPGSSGAPSSASGDSGQSSDTGTAPAPSETESSTSPDEPGRSVNPSPSLVGLCHAWLAHPRDITKVSSNPAFSVLITAAGSADAVDGYCTTLLNSAHPSHPAHPTQAQNTKTHPAHPTQAQNTKTHPAHPTQAQNTKTRAPHPTKKPHPVPTKTP